MADYATIAVFEISSNEKRNESLPIESLSRAFAIAAILAALGQFLNVKMYHVLRCTQTHQQELQNQCRLTQSTTTNHHTPSSSILHIPLIHYLHIVNILKQQQRGDGKLNHIAKAGDIIGTLLYIDGSAQS